MVLWSNLGLGLRGGVTKCGRKEKGRSAGLSEESAGEASNLMRWPVQRGSRNATTSACVGWDLSNIENRPAFRKHGRIGDLEDSLAKTASPPPGSRFRSSRPSVPRC